VLNSAFCSKIRSALLDKRLGGGSIRYEKSPHMPCRIRGNTERCVDVHPKFEGIAIIGNVNMDWSSFDA